MRQESARHPVSITNVVPYLMYFFISAPFVFLALPFAAVREWRQRKLSPLLLLGLMGLFADLLLFLNYSTTINWRYFLTGLPALAPLSADYLIRVLSRLLGSARLAFASCFAVLVALAIVFGLLIRPVSQEFIDRRAMSKEYRQQLCKRAARCSHDFRSPNDRRHLLESDRRRRMGDNWYGRRMAGRQSHSDH